jgi:hypothetical protein
MQEAIPLDPALPALAGAHYETLAAALARLGLEDARAFSLLRYHPGKRCTLTVASRTNRYVAKLFADAVTALAVSTVHHVLAGVGLASGRGPTVPRLIGLDADAALLVTEMYAADPIIELVERSEAERAGRLAAQWLRAAIKPGVTLGDPYDPPQVLADVHRYVRTLGNASAELGERARGVRNRLAANIPPPGCTDLRHGGFYLSHVFDLGDGPGVVDWDTFRQGPVEVDAGMLCAAARWELYQPKHERAVQRAVAVFLDEVADLVDPARLRWYRAAALLKFASHRARRGADELAASLISDAERVLA